MPNEYNISGHNNIVIQDIDDSKITLIIDGNIQEIQNQLSELKQLLKEKNSQSIQYAEKIYNIEHINEANFGLLSGKMAFNEILTKKLIEAIQPYSVDAQMLINYMQENNIPDWASQEKYTKTAKNILNQSYVGVIGMQLSHLMGIGKDNRRRAEDKIIPYIEKCLFIARFSLNLLSFAFISRLWDMQKKTTLSLSDNQRKTLSKFFERRFEPEFLEELELLNILYPLFNTENLPFSEMQGFAQHLVRGSKLYQSFEKLQELKKLAKDKYRFVECAEAEGELSQVLSHFSFLANYNMISIKHVGFKYLRNTDPRYIHNYFELGFDQKANPDVEKHRYEPHYVPTDTVLIHKGEDYNNSLNLFPFVIDYNALTFEQGANIYFYQCLNFRDENILEYAVLKDDEPKNIEFQDIESQNPDYDALVGDKEKLKVLNIDHAIRQFREAKANLTVDNSDIDEDFEARFKS